MPAGIPSIATQLHFAEANYEIKQRRSDVSKQISGFAYSWNWFRKCLWAEHRPSFTQIIRHFNLAMQALQSCDRLISKAMPILEPGSRSQIFLGAGDFLTAALSNWEESPISSNRKHQTNLGFKWCHLNTRTDWRNIKSYFGIQFAKYCRT